MLTKCKNVLQVETIPYVINNLIEIYFSYRSPLQKFNFRVLYTISEKGPFTNFMNENSKFQIAIDLDCQIICPKLFISSKRYYCA